MWWSLCCEITTVLNHVVERHLQEQDEDLLNLSFPGSRHLLLWGLLYILQAVCEDARQSYSLASSRMKTCFMSGVKYQSSALVGLLARA